MTDRAAPGGRSKTAPGGRGLELRLPPHLGVFLGLSTAAYAVSLAGVAALQAHSEADLAAERAPTLAGLDAIAAQNQALADALALANSNYQVAAQEYQAAGGRLADFQAALANLATSVQKINGVTTNLPTSVSLPKVTRRFVTVGAPATSSTTGASGAVVP